MADASSIAARLEKKATFEVALNDLKSVLASSSKTAEETNRLFPLVQRSHTLLRSRYSGVNFWANGKTVFEACKALPLSSEQASKLSRFIQDAEEVLGADDERGGRGSGRGTAAPPAAAAAAAAAAAGIAGGAAAAGAGAAQDGTLPPEAAAFVAEQEALMDLLATGRRERETHFDDAGFIVDDEERWRRAQVSGTASVTPSAAPSTANNGANGANSNGSDSAAAEPGASEAGATGDAAAQEGQQEEGGQGATEGTRSRQQMRQELQRQILEGIQAIYSGMEAVTRGTEAIEHEMQNVIELITSRAGLPPARRGPPPASKKLLASLPVEELSKERLGELGEGSACAVCVHELEVGDKVQVLPCRHIYHPDCVAPWFAKNNSCPVCRMELPTDDPHYEAAKERRAEEEEERRGAANALQGGEFMYR